MNWFQRMLNSTAIRLALCFLINVFGILICSYYDVLYIYFAGCFLISLISIFFISNKTEKDSYKVTVFLLMLILPLFASMYAILLKENNGNKKIRKEWLDIIYRNRKTVFKNSNDLTGLKELNRGAYKNATYIADSLNMPSYTGVDIKYLSDGENYYEELFNDCKKAKKYILIENAKIIPGKIWDKLFEILRLKAREGVEIKLIYDDAVCKKFISTYDYNKMRNHGIETVAFNKVNKIFNGPFINSRNFKRLVVIDGKFGYMGGFSISDEYIKQGEEKTSTKDCAVKLVGDSVKNLIVMFFEDYQFATKKIIKLSDYFVENSHSKHKNWVLPYSKNIIIKEHNNKGIVLNLINSAKESLFISTSYMSLDDELKNALIISARSGVKIKLIYGGIKIDKNTRILARSYFYDLIKEGIEIYEYKRGKLQTKLVIVDKEMALMSTVNLDCQKTYKHFNCGVFMYGEIIKTIVQDSSAIVTNSQIVTIKDLQKINILTRFKATWIKFLALFR